MKKLVICMVAVLAAVFVLSCSSSGSEPKKPSIMANEYEDAPAWVKGNPSGSGEICGIGSAAGTRNPSLARTAAQGRGRTDVARQIQTQVKAMLKDYQSTTTGGENFGTAANDEQHIEDVSKQITNQSLSGVEQNDSWISNTGTLYVRMCMNIDKFKDAVNKMTQLNEQVRQAVVERANKAFNELDQATAQ